MQRNEPCTATLPCIRIDPNNSNHFAAEHFLPTKVRATAAKLQEYPVSNNKNPNQKQTGEKEPGKFHYNPGNMSGKTAGTKKDESESQSTANNGRGHPAPQNK
jgi:hypothetical protein